MLHVLVCHVASFLVMFPSCLHVSHHSFKKKKNTLENKNVQGKNPFVGGGGGGGGRASCFCLYFFFTIEQ